MQLTQEVAVSAVSITASLGAFLLVTLSLDVPSSLPRFLARSLAALLLPFVLVLAITSMSLDS